MARPIVGNPFENQIQQWLQQQDPLTFMKRRTEKSPFEALAIHFQIRAQSDTYISS